jgi:YbgC/YbaW family acyl-CoA thioester hydrolase
MGVVYYANFLVWFEVARADLMRSLGWSYREMEATGLSLPVIEAQCEYQRPARYDDEIEVDGGIDAVTAPVVTHAGATVLVAGSAVFNGQDSVAANVSRLRTSVDGLPGPGIASV